MQKVLILDFGSQFTQLITRRIRELNIYSEIHPFDYDIQKIKSDNDIKAIIFSGGPNSIYEEGSPQIDPEIFDLGLPILGICYGMQLMAQSLGGKVEGSTSREYGRKIIDILDNDSLFTGFSERSEVWMSHGDKVTALPQGFVKLAETETCPYAAAADLERNFYGLQFHPEVVHTQNGLKILENFLIGVAGLNADWTSDSFIEAEIIKIREQVGSDKVLCGLSGGVDSSVAAALIHKAIGDQLHCVFVDHGLLRAGEREEVEKTFRDSFHIELTVVDAVDLFLERLGGISDPEQKRKIIGNTFIEVFLGAIKKIEDDRSIEFLTITESDLVSDFHSHTFKYLAQGTLYPDVVESVSVKGGPSHTIKSHHNVGGLPEKMHLDLVEPLRELFKDEVRAIGRELGVPESIVGRHPFPGPGLAIRIIGEITREKIATLQKADKIFTDGLKGYKVENKTLYEITWQAFAVLTNVQSVGVMGDGRTYENLVALRAVTARDGMTADWAHLPYEFLAEMSNKIINEVKGVNRVAYDISSKPPATIECE